MGLRQVSARSRRPSAVGPRLATLVRLGWRVVRTRGTSYPEFEEYAAREAAAFMLRHAKLSGAVILDVGSGYGSYGRAFERLGARSVSLDVKPLGGPRVVRGDALRLPFRDGAFSGVVCSNLLEHVPSPRAALGEVARVLRPGGWAYVSWTNWYSPFGGHEYSPWHFLGVRAARAIGRYVRLGPPHNVPGRGLFPVHVGQVLRLLRNGSPFRVRFAGPRYWPRLSFIVRVPGLREIATWNCLLVLEKR